MKPDWKLENQQPSNEQGEQVAKRERIIETIYKAVDELNRQRPKEQHLEKSADTVLFGKSGKLDSLGLINLIATVEQKTEEEFKVKITLANETAMTQMDSIFKTIGTLSDYIFMFLKE